jgi:hypothetical protein
MSVTFAAWFAVGYVVFIAAVGLASVAYERRRNRRAIVAVDAHPTRRPALPSGGHAVVVMRPKLVWRVIAPVSATLVVVIAVVSSDWLLALIAIYPLGLAIASLRSYVRVEDWVIYRRMIFRWREPLLLEDLKAIAFEPWWGPGLDRHVELGLFTHGGTRMTIETRWWSNADALIRLIAFVACDEVGDRRSERRWNVDLNDESQKRLAAFL